jgi:hypothetical protein
MRADVLDFLWEKAKPVVFTTKEAFAQELGTWNVEAVEIDGKLAFITIQKGPEFHFESLDTKHPITRKMITDFLRPIIAEHGFAQTRTPIEDTRQQRFNELFGFRRAGEDGFDILYQIEAVKCR